MKKSLGITSVALLALVNTAFAGGTVVVAPARYNVMQVGFDLAARNGVTLVSYQGEATTEKPLIHVWNGQEWSYVTLPDFQAGTFLNEKPTQTLIIGDEHMVPQVFAPISVWAGKQLAITSVLTPDILNKAGNALKFRTEDWQWFAGRYSMKVQDINAPIRKTSIYDNKIGEPFTLKDKRVAPKAEMVQPAIIPSAKIETIAPLPIATNTLVIKVAAPPKMMTNESPVVEAGVKPEKTATNATPSGVPEK